jgi:RNA polymerase sigma factor (sigma-70 family)
VRIINHSLERLIRRRVAPERPAAGDCETDAGWPEPAIDITSVATKAMRSETAAAVSTALAGLSARDREIVILRGIEGRCNLDVAAEVGESPDTVSHRYRRALIKLRRLLPGSAFWELHED